MFIIKLPSNKIQISNIVLYIQENSEKCFKNNEELCKIEV